MKNKTILKLVAVFILFIFLKCSKSEKNDTELNKIGALISDSAKSSVEQININDTSEVNLKADLMYATDQYADALELYAKLWAIDSLNGKFNYRIGFCLVKLKKYHEATKYYFRSINLNFKKFESYESLGIIYYMGLHDYPKAKKYFEKCLEINPGSSEIKKYIEGLGENETKKL